MNRIPHLGHIVFCFVLAIKTTVPVNTVPKENEKTKEFILSLNGYFLRAYDKPATLLGVWDTTMRKTGKSLLS